MKEKLRFLGLDVHAETIAVAVAEPEGEVRSLGTIPNRAESIRKLIKKLGPADKLRACYEAGPTGYVVYWQLAELGVECEVVAPTLVPVKAGDRVKTDRRDAEKLARCYRSGDLTAVWVQPEPRARYRAMLELGYIDAFRSLHPGMGGQFTFWDYFRQAFEHNRGIRIDHFLLTPDLAKRLQSCEIDNGPRALEKPSDHTPIVVRLE